jgi:RNA polymerase sigma-70 factor (ECF subfamily)
MKKPTEQKFSEWAEKIGRSDKRAFDDLFRSFYPVLIRFAMRYLKDKTVSKDIVQEVFISLWQTRKRIDPARSLKSYLYMMVRNRALNAIRDRSDVYIDHDLASNEQSDQIDDQQMETDSDESELGYMMKKWIDQLPGRQKEALKLSRFEGLDHDEIAYVMDVSPKTVNNHIVAALRSLRDEYEQYENHSNS